MNPIHGLASLLAYAMTQAAANDVILLPGTPTYLAPPVIPAPTGPRGIPTFKSTKLSGVFGVLADLGSKFNHSVVYAALEKNFQKSFEAAWGDALKQGQCGVLMKVSVISHPTDGGAMLTLLGGDGVQYTGAGPDPDAVCYATKCYGGWQQQLQPGESLTPESSYIWITNPDGKAFRAQVYNISSLEARARTVRLTEATSAAYARAIQTAAFHDYATSLQAHITEKKDKAAIEQLLESRDDSLAKLKEVDQQLNKELEHQAAIARTTAALRGLAAAFQFASSAVEWVNASTGDDVRKFAPNGTITSTEELMAAMANMATQADTNVKSLTLRQVSLKDGLTGFEGSIIEIGVKYQRPPPGPGTVVNPLP